MKTSQTLFALFIFTIISVLGCNSPSPEQPDATSTIIDASLQSQSLNPKLIEVTQGDNITLRLTTDEPGDIHITGYEIVKELNVNKKTEISFIAETAGRFNLEIHPATEKTHDTHPENQEHAKAHDVRNVPPENAPTISMTISEDAEAGYNLEFNASKIRFVPQTPDIKHVEGEGHAHVYINGVKIGRFYEKNAYLGKLSPGTHEVRATLSDNVHREYASNDNVISHTLILNVTEQENSTSDHEPYESRNVKLENAPTLNVSVTEDPSAGWNLILQTTNFEYDTAFVSRNHSPGKGHAHLYVDDEILTRLYGPAYHLGSLSEGNHSIRIVLSDNAHNEYAVNNTPIAFEFVLQGKQGGKNPYSAYDGMTITAKKPAEHMEMKHDTQEKNDENDHIEEDIVVGSLVVNPR